MVRSAIQFYTLRHLNEPVPELLDRVAETSFDGAEFRISDGEIEDAITVLETEGLDIANLNSSLEVIEDNFDELVERCELLGCETITVSHGSDKYTSREEVEETVRRFREAAEALNEAGLTLLYHNHDWEFEDVGGVTPFFELVDEVGQLEFELDLGWVGTAGEDPYELLNELGHRVPSVHIKDMYFGEREFAEVGEGDLDLDRAFETVHSVDADWAIYENDEPDDPVESLEHASDVFDRYV